MPNLQTASFPQLTRKTIVSPSFTQLPNIIYDRQHPIFSQLTSKDRELFAKLRNQLSINIHEHYLPCKDKAGYYVEFSIRQAMDFFGWANKTIHKAYKKLEDLGLIKRIKQGGNKPDKIFVMDIDNPAQAELEKITEELENSSVLLTDTLVSSKVVHKRPYTFKRKEKKKIDDIDYGTATKKNVENSTTEENTTTDDLVTKIIAREIEQQGNTFYLSELKKQEWKKQITETYETITAKKKILFPQSYITAMVKKKIKSQKEEKEFEEKYYDEIAKDNMSSKNFQIKALCARIIVSKTLRKQTPRYQAIEEYTTMGQELVELLNKAESEE